MLETALFCAALLLAAWLFARLEIEIEGSEGWAASLPTWRKEVPWLAWLFGSRPLTGYHLYAFLFIAVAVHVPFAVIPAAWSAAAELQVLGFLVLFWVLEDFLWFVLNPAFGLRAFRPSRAWWHADGWLGPLPRPYWIFVPIGIALVTWGRLLAA
ncbi:MAG: hypothetical protein RRA92_05780 [Gemmatimonadota bacterium]|nr:hypothetical protein [Gemmatimonadota bacterium]